MSFAQDVAALLNLPQESAFSLEEEQQLYALAYHCYEVGDYAQAVDFFTKLVLVGPFTEKYWRGLASSQQMHKQYRAAIHAWAVLALLEGEDPVAHFHAAECLLSLEEKQEALKALNAAESLLRANPEDDALRDKITVLKSVHYYD